MVLRYRPRDEDVPLENIGWKWTPVQVYMYAISSGPLGAISLQVLPTDLGINNREIYMGVAWILERVVRTNSRDKGDFT